MTHHANNKSMHWVNHHRLNNTTRTVPELIAFLKSEGKLSNNDIEIAALLEQGVATLEQGQYHEAKHLMEKAIACRFAAKKSRLPLSELIFEYTNLRELHPDPKYDLVADLKYALKECETERKAIEAREKEIQEKIKAEVAKQRLRDKPKFFQRLASS